MPPDTADAYAPATRTVRYRGCGQTSRHRIRAQRSIRPWPWCGVAQDAHPAACLSTIAEDWLMPACLAIRCTSIGPRSTLRPSRPPEGLSLEVRVDAMSVQRPFGEAEPVGVIFQTTADPDSPAGRSWRPLRMMTHRRRSALRGRSSR